MPYELNAHDAVGTPTKSRPSSESTSVRRSLRLTDTFDMTTATKAEVERALPLWHRERQRLNEERVGRRGTTEGDMLFVGLVRVVGSTGAVAVACAAAWFAYSASGAVSGVVAGAIGLAVVLAATFGLSAVSKSLFDRSERSRREAVTRLDLDIRLLDERIGRAFLSHGLVPHARTPTSY